MPYLSSLATFRDAVRKEARSLKATNILAECDKLRDDVLPELGVRLEDKVIVGKDIFLLLQFSILLFLSACILEDETNVTSLSLFLYFRKMSLP